ncbi:MAG: glucose dehydrogenase, partial [Gammaproteobacteria bacterium]|nr:glucose dehydrogenase [Gammaproteobacteria bacterium]
PWRWSFDRVTGDMFIGDVGQNSVEEISFQAAGVGGLNYGWDCKEGNQNFPGGSTCSDPLTDPILSYSHSLGCSVTGGYRYSGSHAPFLGKYVYGDFCTGRIWIATENSSGVWSSLQWLDTTIRISTFGEDKNGNIYLADLGGAIYRIKTPVSTGIVPILQLLLD